MSHAKTSTKIEHDQKIAMLKFASVYPHYINKVERKGRTQAELDAVIEWLTGFSKLEIAGFSESPLTFQEFFEKAQLNPNASKIKGVICGYRVEEIENTLTRNVRYLDKIVDELAKGKTIDAICRK